MNPGTIISEYEYNKLTESEKQNFKVWDGLTYGRPDNLSKLHSGEGVPGNPSLPGNDDSTG